MFLGPLCYFGASPSRHTQQIPGASGGQESTTALMAPNWSVMFSADSNCAMAVVRALGSASVIFVRYINIRFFMDRRPAACGVNEGQGVWGTRPLAE